jgi:hypothetical protein
MQLRYLFLIFIVVLSSYNVFSDVSIENLTLTSTSGDNLVTDNLTCNFDLNDTATTSAISWYKNNTPLMNYYLPMEGNSTNALIDYSGTAQTTTTTGTWSATRGYGGKGAIVMTASQIIKVTSSNTKELSSNFTITFWMNGTNWANSVNEPSIVSRANGGNGAILLTADSTTGQVSFVEDTTPSSCSFNTITLGTSARNKYWFVAMVYNGTNRSVYFNTTKYNGTGCNAILESDGTSDLIFGTAFAGAMDDIIIYNKTLSEEQIFALYNNKLDTIVSQETKLNDVWQCRVTPFNSTKAGITYQSNNLTITDINYCEISTNITISNKNIFCDTFKIINPVDVILQNVTYNFNYTSWVNNFFLAFDSLSNLVVL